MASEVRPRYVIAEPGLREHPSARRFLTWIAAAVLFTGAIAYVVFYVKSTKQPSYVVDGPVVSAGSDGNAMSAVVLRGRLTMRGGCVRNGSNVVYWPFGTAWDRGRDVVVLENGQRLGDGDFFNAAGTSNNQPFMTPAQMRHLWGSCWHRGIDVTIVEGDAQRGSLDLRRSTASPGNG